MANYINGKIKPDNNKKLLNDDDIPKEPLAFSPQAKAVFDSGLALWRYYHTQEDGNVNASLYDIREYFQGRNDSGKMNATNQSHDETYKALMKDVKEKLDILAKVIEPKVYEYRFLLE